MLIASAIVATLTVLAATLLAICTIAIYLAQKAEPAKPAGWSTADDRRALIFPGKRSQIALAMSSSLLALGFHFGLGFDALGSAIPNDLVALCGVFSLLSDSANVVYRWHATLGVTMVSIQVEVLCSVFSDVMTVIDRRHPCSFLSLSSLWQWRWFQWAFYVGFLFAHIVGMSLGTDVFTSNFQMYHGTDGKVCMLMQFDAHALWWLIPEVSLFGGTCAMMALCMARALRRIGHQKRGGELSRRLQRQKRHVVRIISGVGLVSLAGFSGPIVTLIVGMAAMPDGSSSTQRFLPLWCSLVGAPIGVCLSIVFAFRDNRLPIEKLLRRLRRRNSNTATTLVTAGVGHPQPTAGSTTKF